MLIPLLKVIRILREHRLDDSQGFLSFAFREFIYSACKNAGFRSGGDIRTSKQLEVHVYFIVFPSEDGTCISMKLSTNSLKAINRYFFCIAIQVSV